jgi:hypothetical protein
VTVSGWEKSQGAVKLLWMWGTLQAGCEVRTKWPRVRAARTTNFGSGAPARKHLSFTAADHGVGSLHLPRGTCTHDDIPYFELCYPNQANRCGGGGLQIPWNASRARGQPALPSIGSLQQASQRDVSVLPQPCLCISAPVTWFCSRSTAQCSVRRGPQRSTPSRGAALMFSTPLTSHPKLIRSNSFPATPEVRR